MISIAEGRPCPLCEQPLARRVLPDFFGDEAPLRLVFKGMRALTCPAPHRYFIDHEFPMWLMNHLVEEDESRFPAGTGAGFLFKRYTCQCGGALKRREDHRHVFTVPLQYKDHPAFTAEVSMPVYKCEACGKEQLHSLDELRKLTPAALVHAFKAAGIKAPG